MIVKEASYPSLEWRCLLQITDATGAVEELPLEFRGNGIPAHKHGRAQTLQNLLFFLNKGSTVVVIFYPLDRLIDMDCHPFFVFGKRRVGLLEIEEFPRFVRRTRCVGEKRLNSAALARYCSAANILHALQAGAQRVSLLTGAVGCTDWSILDACGDDRAN